MNSSELKILRNGSLSHAARLTYVLALAPSANNGMIKTNYSLIQSAIHIEPVLDFSGNMLGGYEPDFQEINKLIIELIQSKLIVPLDECEYDGYYNALRFSIPLKQTTESTTYNLFRMNLNWRPDANFNQIARLCGLSDSRYSLIELNDFIAYWSGIDKAQDAHHWNMAFIQHLKRIHRQA